MIALEFRSNSWSKIAKLMFIGNLAIAQKDWSDDVATCVNH